MANVMVCDICNNKISVGAERKKLAVVYGGQRVFDLHPKCYNAMLNWMDEQREKSSKFKTTEEIRAGK